MDQGKVTSSWALFLTRFNFTIPYRPGNRNCKADALSRLYSLESHSQPEPIIPPALIVSPIQWNISENISVATLTEPAPLGGPEGKTYVPTSQRQPLLGLIAQYSGLWTPRQHTDPLAPSSSVLVAQYDPGCHPVRPQLLSLCHVEDAPTPPSRQTRATASPTTTLVPNMELILWWITPTLTAIPVSW